MAQLAIDAAEKEDFTVALELHQMLKNHILNSLNMKKSGLTNVQNGHATE